MILLAALVAVGSARAGVRAIRPYLHARALEQLHGGGESMPDEDTDARYFEILLTARQRDLVLQKLKEAKHPGDVRKGAIRALEVARPTDLPPGQIDWDEAERLAHTRGSSLAELIWDEGRTDEPRG